MRAVVLLWVLAACGNQDKLLDLNFPSETTFVRSGAAYVSAVALEPGQEGICPQLLQQAQLGGLEPESVVAESGLFGVCDFRAGAVSVPDVPEGLLAYVAIANSDLGHPLLAGCKVADVYAEEGDLQIVLSPTSVYREMFMAGTGAPPCTIDDKCTRGCR